MSLRIGQLAPEFDVVASNGQNVRLADYRGKKNVVLFFYPADFTLVCTREACGFRELYPELVSRDTEVIGISTDSNESHER
ncbi:MAG: redoxin domain-containing protein, partial [Myxococcales bacterium]|nr:redoxin domain-containing protein [Myxococcales bacterium]